MAQRCLDNESPTVFKIWLTCSTAWPAKNYCFQKQISSAWNKQAEMVGHTVWTKVCLIRHLYKVLGHKVSFNLEALSGCVYFINSEYTMIGHYVRPNWNLIWQTPVLVRKCPMSDHYFKHWISSCCSSLNINYCMLSNAQVSVGSGPDDPVNPGHLGYLFAGSSRSHPWKNYPGVTWIDHMSLII